MPVRNVNGQNAYVIEVAIDQPRTSRGEGWGQYVTNLRWKMWEEAQKSELLAIDFEKMAYQEQLRYYAAQRKAIQDEIDATRRAINSLNAKELARDQAIENNRTAAQNTENRRVAGQQESRRRFESSQQFQAQPRVTTTEGETTGGGVGGTRRTPTDLLADLSADTQDSFQRVQEQASRAGATETDEANRITTSAAKAQEQGAYQMGAAGGVTSGEQRAFKAAVVAAEIKDARDNALAAGGDADAAEQAVRDAFAADYIADYDAVLAGEVDESGFGAPGGTEREGRATREQLRTMPVTGGLGAPVEEAAPVDYSGERARLQAELQRLTDQLGNVQLPEAPSVDLLERTRGKFQSAYGEGGFGLAPRRQRELPRFDEPAAVRGAQDLARVGAEQGVRDFLAANPDKTLETLTPEELRQAQGQGVRSLLSQLGGRAVAEKDFLRVTEPTEEPATAPPTTQETDPLFGGEEGVAQELDRALDGLYPSEEVIDQARRERVLPFSPELQPPPVSAELPGRLPSRREGAQMSRTKRLTDLEYLTEMEALGYRDEALANLQEESRRRAIQASPESYYGDVVPEGATRPTLMERIPVIDQRSPPAPPVPESPYTIPEQPATLLNPFTGERREVLPSPERAEARAERRAETTQTRRERYKLNIIRGATRLANQPKRFERIAKPNLAPEERAKKVADYVIVVDNLYETNRRTSGDPIVPSYEELNRVYADDPRTREQAQEYLLAKQILEVSAANPTD